MRHFKALRWWTRWSRKRARSRSARMVDRAARSLERGRGGPARPALERRSCPSWRPGCDAFGLDRVGDHHVPAEALEGVVDEARPGHGLYGRADLLAVAKNPTGEGPQWRPRQGGPARTSTVRPSSSRTGTSSLWRDRSNRRTTWLEPPRWLGVLTNPTLSPVGLPFMTFRWCCFVGRLSEDVSVQPARGGATMTAQPLPRPDQRRPLRLDQALYALLVRRATVWLPGGPSSPTAGCSGPSSPTSGKTPDRVKPADVLAWVPTVSQVGTDSLKPRRRGQSACLSSFYRFLIRMGLVVSNPCDAVERPRATQSVARGYGADEVRRLLAVVPDTVAVGATGRSSSPWS